MGKLLIFNTALILLIAVGLWLTKKYAVTARKREWALLAAAAATILFHYSTLLFKLFTGGGALAYLAENPNLLLPIYPCNVVMWAALLFALLKSKEGRLGRFLSDYLFWFGIVATLVGMFANVDFIKNPTLADYENVKSIGAHATLLYNVLLLPLFGYTGVGVKRNMKSILLCILMMAVIGGYCNLVFFAIGSAEVAYEVNSMFLLHSPFEGVALLTYPVISLIALPIYYAVFTVCACLAARRRRARDRFSGRAQDAS